MNKTLPLAALLLLIGSGVAAAVPDKKPANLLGDDRKLNSVYAHDQQGNYIGVLFEDEDQARMYGNVDSLDQLNRNSTQVCKQFIRQGGFLQGERVSQVRCHMLSQDMQQTGPIPSINQTNVDREESGITRVQYQGNNTFSPPQSIPDFFRAYDRKGNNINIVVDNKGRASRVYGTVGSIDALNRDSTVACEYYFQLNVFDRDNPSEINCFGYDELQQRIQNGSITYLPLNQVNGSNTRNS